MQKSSYSLKIEYDDTPLNPREDYDNFGHMMCWHRNYNLGDKNEHDEPSELLKQMIRDTLSADEVISYTKKGNSDDIRLFYDRSNREWTLQDKYNDKWFTEYTFSPGTLKDSDMAKEYILELMPLTALNELAQQKNVILPLYLYDHSGITISCSHSYPYNDRWDAGQVGWIYASHDEIKKEYGNIDNETLEKAKQLLISETETYDNYLRGNSYGYIIEQDGIEVDSCWGYLGDLREMIAEMKLSVSEEYQHLFDHVDYCCMEYSENAELDEDDEDEYDM